MDLWIAATAVAVIALVLAERRASVLPRAVAKLAASSGFLAVAWLAGAADSPYGLAILVGLVLSWIGDAFLLSAKRGPFLAGLGGFLLAHVAYVVAFVVVGPSAVWTTLALVPLVGVAVLVWRWLRPSLDPGMVGPVGAYVVAITAMVALSFGAYGAGGRVGVVAIPAGAIAFFLSDLSVARDRFVAPGWSNRAWGLPLYYLGQILLASSVA